MNSFVRHHHGLIRFGYHCFDRILCIARIPALLNMGHVVRFLKDRRGATQLSPAFFRNLSGQYHQWVKQQAQAIGVDIVDAPTDRHVRRYDWVEPYYHQLGTQRGTQKATQMGTAVILQAREPARVIVSYPQHNFHLETVSRYVKVYNFYLRDPHCGRLFLRVCPYFPFNVQLCLNGHEWLAQQLRREGIAFRQVENAFLDCADPRRLQELADSFDGAVINDLLQRALQPWLPYFTPEERRHGYVHQAYLAQVEYCDNLVFHQQAALERLFERLIDLNRTIGRPDQLAIVFGRPAFRPDTRTGQTKVTIAALRTPVLKSSFKQTSLKQYVKSNVLLRTEAATSQLNDLSLRKSVAYLEPTRKALHTSNQRYLDVQQDVLGSFIDRGHLQRLRQATVSPTGRRTPGLRLDDPRLLALWQALTCFVHLVGPGSFRTKDLLSDMRRVLNQPDYQLGQLRYDLSKLRGKGLVERLSHSQRYRITPEGLRLAIVVIKIYHRLLAPLTSGVMAPLSNDHRLLDSRRKRLDRLYATLDQSLTNLTRFLALAA